MADSSLVPVRVSDCRCPESPHADGDFVYLFPELGLKGGYSAERAILDLGKANPGTVTARQIEAELGEVYVRYGVAEWTFLDDESKPIPVNPETIEKLLIRRYALSRLVADKADDLYTAAILDPLVNRLSKSSRSTRTRGSTSRRTSSRAVRRKRSKPSSTTTSGKEPASV